ncbi:hypothetical protein E2C01_085348 [Portunus trituberculatus]|uniref:Uncharacterized protein n=1 Tax=Portunus trituberculatus TaxID=210409 RepID=A0A5B7JA84_PORTR|nr:hypothetical protein [Portunus trituberculatus]
MVVSSAWRWPGSCCAAVRSEEQNANDLDYSVVAAKPDTGTCSLTSFATPPLHSPSTHNKSCSPFPH